MNARATLTSAGDVAIPEDVRRQLHLAAGAHLAVSIVDGEIRLRPVGNPYPFGGKSVEDLRKLPRLRPAQPIEAISSLSNDAIRRLLDEGD